MSLMSISLTALNAAQAGLTTTGHNIANSSTDGYNRQRVIQSAQTGLFTGAGFFGQGAKVDAVQRIYSQFQAAQVMSASTAKAEFSTYNTEIKQIDNLLADDTVGLSPAIDNFFKGLQELSTNPSSIPSRQSLLSSSQSLVERFHALSQRLTEIRSGVKAQLSESAQTVTSLAKQVAELNYRIGITESGGAGLPANDLHDLRDQLISKINEQVRVTASAQSDGQINLFFGSGQPLVVGQTAYGLTVGQSPTNPEEQAIFSTVGSSSILISDNLISGGVMGGLIRFRDEALNVAQNELGKLAVTITKNMNDQHALGQDLDGSLGGLYFKNLTPDVKQLSSTAAVSVTASYTQAEDLKSEDYTLSYFTATGYTLRRNSDGMTVYTGATPPDGTTTDPTNADKTLRYGFSLTMGSTPTDGDTFLIQPTRKAAESMQMAIQDTRKVAAAAPFALAAETSNTGTAKIGGGQVVSLTGFDTAVVDGKPDFGTVTVTYNATTKTFSAVNAAGAAVTLNVRSGVNTLDPADPGTPQGTLTANNSYDPAIDGAGKTFEIGSPAMSFTISGDPANGDVFRITTNPLGTSDNRNALALGALQNAKTMLNGGASYGYAYSQLVSDVGTKSRDAEVGVTAQEGLYDQAIASQQSISGVNLDEEAANLIRYQQAYQAAARAMNIAKSLFDEVLSIAR
ncbi:flagellar hook-associated protein FlgK [Uliginosibacterium sp. H3]|uniref:Flagellar hook-associated protein 1 n=1 Tax=Uliginosibacterium silvisoli TaxID=3114758 RepID=A0ABU6K8P9_9RHOO|nr:flagellar hook-associated protein FlgK [Uliginosibacterium sp. H3]